MSKYTRSVFAAVTVLVIILPLPGLIRNGINFDADFIFEDNITLDEDYLLYAKRVKLGALERGVVQQLDEDGIHNVTVTVEGTVNGTDIKIELVRVNLQNAVIDEIGEHIHKNELVKGLVAKYLLIEEGQVTVYGE